MPSVECAAINAEAHVAKDALLSAGGPADHYGRAAPPSPRQGMAEI